MAARYALKIDGEKVGDFTKEQLAEGINLALEPTPMLKQASSVYDLTVKHNDVHFARWREIQVPLCRNSTSRVSRRLWMCWTTWKTRSSNSSALQRNPNPDTANWRLSKSRGTLSEPWPQRRSPFIWPRRAQRVAI